jgi:hypothetical protein
VKAAGIAIASWDGSIYCSAVRLGWCASLGIAPHAQTGWTASAGFLALGAAWIVATGLAVRFILRGHAIRHRRWMIRSYALRNSGHPCLCLFHARAESQFIETERLGCDLAQTISGDFMTATDINRAMGRLYTAVAQDRIPIRNANALARIGRMMLNTIPGIKSESEFPFSYKFEEWNKMLDASKRLSLPSSAAIPNEARNPSSQQPRHAPPTIPTSTIPAPPKPLIPSPPAQAGKARIAASPSGFSEETAAPPSGFHEENLSSSLTSAAPSQLMGSPPAPAQSTLATQNEKTSPSPTPDTLRHSPPPHQAA